MFGVVYSVVAYLGFLGSFSYFALFSAGVFVPKHVDTGAAPAGVVEFLLVNLGLLLLFGAQHSVMARASFKAWLTRLVPAGLERATYVLASDVALTLLVWQWRPHPQVVWNVETPALRVVLWATCAVGWLGVPLCSLLIDHFDLVGLKQSWAAFRRRSLERTGFVTPALYRYVRHPMMSCLLLGAWATPHMTVGHLLLAAGLTAYVLIGVHFEEKSLVRDLGGAYRDYQEATPRFVPLGRRGRAEAERVTT